MFSIPKSYCRSCSPRCQYHYLSLNQPLRTYATPPQSWPHNQSKSTPKSANTKAQASIKTSAVSPQSVHATRSLTSRINPPASTHPPPLTLPSRNLTDPAYKYYFRLGKAYIAFYKDGLKAIWINYRAASNLPNDAWSKSSTEIRRDVTASRLSRADFQLIQRVWHDLYKLPTFALLFMICGEFTPLVVVFVTGLVPRIIWLPEQFRKKRNEAEERRKACQRKGGFSYTARDAILRDEASALTDPNERDITMYVAQSLGLYPSILDRFLPAYVLSGLARRRVDKRLKDLEVDDFAIARDGGVKSMDKEEIVMACEDRGIDLSGREDSQLRQDLSEWIEQRRRQSKGRKGVEGDSGRP